MTGIVSLTSIRVLCVPVCWGIPRTGIVPWICVVSGAGIIATRVSGIFGIHHRLTTVPVLNRAGAATRD